MLGGFNLEQIPGNSDPLPFQRSFIGFVRYLLPLLGTRECRAAAPSTEPADRAPATL